MSLSQLLQAFVILATLFISKNLENSIKYIVCYLFFIYEREYIALMSEDNSMDEDSQLEQAMKNSLENCLSR